jgi:hypothetical protein
MVLSRRARRRGGAGGGGAGVAPGPEITGRGARGGPLEPPARQLGHDRGFYGGDVPGLPDTPPDFTGSRQEVAAGMASMDSPFEPIQATIIAPFQQSS